MALKVCPVVKVHIHALDILHEVRLLVCLTLLRPLLQIRNRACLLLGVFVVGAGLLILSECVWVFDHHCATVFVNVDVLSFLVSPNVSFKSVVISLDNRTMRTAASSSANSLAGLHPVIVIAGPELFDILQRTRNKL